MITSSQTTHLIETLNRIASALEALTGGKISAPHALALVPTSPWDSPSMPEGYDTVLGYFSKTLPSAFDMMSEPVADTQRDGFWLTHQAHRRGIEVIKVDAPEALADSGITQLNAYPVALLQERIAA